MSRQPSHCRVLERREADPPTEIFELESGDTLALGLYGDRILLSLDDVLQTLPRRSGEVGLPTGALSAAEARQLAGRLIRFAEVASRAITDR